MKITFPELVARVAIVTGLQKKTTEDFLKGLFATISSTLAEGETVKINGLGTFKLITIEARKSVNVNTGEEFEIPSHRRVSFIPAKELALAVNRPFETFVAVEIPDGMDEKMLEECEEEGKDSQSYEETSSITLNQPIIDQVIEPAEQDIEAVEDKEVEATGERDIPADLEVQIEEDVPEDIDESSEETEKLSEEKLETAEEGKESTVKIITEEEPEEKEEHDEGEEPENTLSDEESSLEESSEIVENNDEDYQEEVTDNSDDEDFDLLTDRKKNRFGKGFFAGFFTAVAFVAVMVGLYYWISYDDNSGKVSQLVKTEAEKGDKIEIAEAENIKDTDSVINSAADVSEKVAEETVLPDTKPSDEAAKKTKEVVYDTITTTRYLTTMARAHYGNYNLWAYIYKENEKILGHPDRIKPGTRVVIPDLAKYGINPKNKEDIDKGRRLGVEIYNKYKK